MDPTAEPDVVLIGAGIMSTTFGVLPKQGTQISILPR
jgi:L-2-hydroxyglutarate oxidase LhgO